MKGTILDCPRAVLNKIKDSQKQVTTKTVVFYVDTNQEVIDTRVFSAQNGRTFELNFRQIFTPALLLDSSNIIVVFLNKKHSYRLVKSMYNYVKLLQQAGLVLHIELIDYLVASQNRYYSFRESGLL